MSRVATWLVRLVGALHVLIGVNEILRGSQMAADFGMTEVGKAKLILINAGLYNLFVAFLIFWALRQAEQGRKLLAISLGFAFVAGLVGTATLSSLLPVALQTVPAAIALIAWKMTPDRT